MRTNNKEDAMRIVKGNDGSKLDGGSGAESGGGTSLFTSILDTPALQPLLDSFHNLTRISLTVVDHTGRVVAISGLQDACTKFHRLHPDLSKHCRESQTELTGEILPETFKFYKCKNNMWKVTSPIVAGGRRLGNIFLGPFFFEDESVDYDYFRTQARRYRLDEKEYIAALERVPRFKREKVEKIIEFTHRFIHMFARLSFSNIELASSLVKRETLFDSMRDRKERWQFALEGAGDGVWDWNVQTGELFLSKHWKAMLGYARHEIKDSFNAWRELIHPEDRQQWWDDYQKLFRGELPACNNEHRLQCKDGTYTWVVSRGKVIEWLEDNKPLRAVGIIADITPRKQAEEALRESRRRFDDIIDFLPEATFVIDHEGKVIAWNRAMEKYTGISKEKIIGKGDNEYSIMIYGDRRKLLIDQALMPDNPLPGLERQYSSLSRDGDRLYGEICVSSVGTSRKEDGEIHQAITASTLRDPSGKIIGAIQNLRNITGQKLFEEKLKYLSLHDQLTGLYNRNYFEHERRRLAKGRDYPVTIIVADLDNLKMINDTMGHAAGDRLLKDCAKALQVALRRSDILARVGGDEFAVLLPRTDAKTGEEIVQRIRLHIDGVGRGVKGLPLSVSIGEATAKDKTDSLEEAYQRADDLMYQDKLAKKGSIADILMAALAERNYITEGHARRIKVLCQKMGRRIGLSHRKLANLTLLAQVHDLGKVGISDGILFKTGPLTEKEWELMRQHSEKGYRIALSSPELAHIAELILKHHERWDGSGYPLGLAGEEIPVECRILAIADAFDAMTNERPYCKIKSKKEAIIELVKGAGTQFDPELTSVFISIIS